MQQRFSYLQSSAACPPKYKYNEFTSRERLRFLCDRKLPLVAYSCLAGGGYADKSRFAPDYVLGSRYDTLTEMAADKGVSANALVVAWMVNLYRVKDYPTVIPLFASSNARHFTENLSGCEIELTDEEMETLTKA